MQTPMEMQISLNFGNFKMGRICAVECELLDKETQKKKKVWFKSCDPENTEMLERIKNELNALKQLQKYGCQFTSKLTLNDLIFCKKYNLVGILIDDINAQQLSSKAMGNYSDEINECLQQLYDKYGIEYDDIKHGNFFVDNEGNIKIIDFEGATIRSGENND